MVVMSRERYIAEANRQLCDTDVYQQVSSTVVFDVIEEVMDILLSSSIEWRHHRGYGYLRCSCRFKTGSFLHSPKGS